MTILKATFTVNTPMFLGGADNTSTAELRPTSFKGVLRFWWRALAWSRLGKVDEVRREEADLFGSSDQAVGQSKVLLKLDMDTPAVLLGKDTSLAEKMPGACYLGYGAIHYNGQLTRPCLDAGFSFTVTMRFRKKASSKTDKPETAVSEKQIQGVIQALKAMSFFGGLGSKSRKGYGSLTLLELTRDGETIYSQPKNVDELRQQIAAFWTEAVGTPSPTKPRYSAFSAYSWAELLQTDRDAFQLLDSVGKAMQMYRSYGLHGKVNGQAAEQNFEEDHHLVRKAILGTPPTELPKRVVFGLPHNYFFSGIKKKAEVKARQDRRASPLHLHIHRLGNGEYAAIALCLPAVFLPPGSRIMVNRTPLEAKVDYQVIRDFVDGSEKYSGKPRFPRKQTLITATQEA